VAESRVKEIGVRKVLGASVFNITKLFSLDLQMRWYLMFVLWNNCL
jgi:hypothetical protein